MCVCRSDRGRIHSHILSSDNDGKLPDLLVRGHFLIHIAKHAASLAEARLVAAIPAAYSKKTTCDHKKTQLRSRRNRIRWIEDYVCHQAPNRNEIKRLHVIG
ncbi:hypothetical protein PAESOLCIP111_02129 [Paenibacillus solanacearum]|uniref:Uncharacterized protein n=1 Tax=Paenibacillus solanacearum TaxID=2048548 RepID=A0A916NIR0_9BACL|nr:hypothetical protein PAESOLCIP111_02129 [Paenibacillus solanacearum]